MIRSLAIRRTERRAMLGGARRCACCWFEDVLALEAGSPVLCAACNAIIAGRSSIERHHVAGRRNGSVTIDIGTNPHRILSERQRLWPKETLENRFGSTQLRIAGHLRGFADVLVTMIPELPTWLHLHAQCGTELLVAVAEAFESESKVTLVSDFPQEPFQ